MGSAVTLTLTRLRLLMVPKLVPNNPISVCAPLVGAIFSLPKDSMKIKVGAATFLVGDFLDALISFLIVATVVFFLVVKPVNYLVSLSHREESPDPTTRKCPECLSEIPIDARRCAFCTQLQAV